MERIFSVKKKDVKTCSVLVTFHEHVCYS